MKEYRQGDYAVRKFEEDEWQQLKAIRLEALKTYPDRLNQPYEEALEYTEDNWRNILKDQNKVTFAIFHADEIIGYHFVQKNSNENYAGSNGSYIRRQHNWRGIDALLFASAIDWAKEQGLTIFRASCKETNYASIRLFKKYGGSFVFKGEQEETYGDGSLAKAVHYELKL